MASFLRSTVLFLVSQFGEARAYATDKHHQHLSPIADRFHGVGIESRLTRCYIFRRNLKDCQEFGLIKPCTTVLFIDTTYRVLQIPIPS